MKYLLNGVAIAAALAIAAPVWAQAPKPASPAAPKPAAAAPMAGAPMAPMAGKQRAKRGGARMAKRGPAESTTDQLNRQELARIQGGGGAAPAQAMPSSTTPAAIGGPKQP